VRVIAGAAGGIPLLVPRGEVRPTMDKVRGAIFDSLRDVVPGARVLDLFAGSGALGIEALSRGAAGVVFVEKERRAADTIERNLAKTRLSAAIHCGDVFSYLDRLAAPQAFDLVLADPPYAHAPGEREFDRELLTSASLQRALAPGGIFILEHLPGAKLPLGEAWECFRQKRYGATEVAMLRGVQCGTGL
jgi:16S rRNA (guanine966-N2)-methyltransferase